MTKQPKTPQLAAPDTGSAGEESKTGRAWYFWPLVGLVVMTVIFVVGLIVALVLAIVTDSGDVANVVSIIRDLFIIVLGEGYFPINVLNAVKMVPEICRIYCATANLVQVVLAETDQGRGVLGVVDGQSPLGVEDAEGVAWRTGFLRQIGYKA